MHAKTLIFFLSLLILGSCYLWDGDEEKFMDAYTEILIIRAKFPDTAVANKKVAKVLEKYGYTYESFREQFEYFYKDSGKFMTMMDTIRERARREIIKLEDQKTKERDTAKPIESTASKTFTGKSG